MNNRPWTDYKQSDYSIDQWHKACLIHQHDGPPTSKNQCKLPVRTPDGVLNRFGVIAAAAVLDGARAPINASPEETKKAAKALLGLYKQIGSSPPKALLGVAAHSSESLFNNFLSHHGVKGMKWGVRNKRNRLTAKEQKARAKRMKVSSNRRTLSNKAIQEHIDRLVNEKKLKTLVEEDLSPGKAVAKRILSTSGQRVATTVVTGAGLYATKAVLEKKFSAKEAAGFLAPKPKSK